MYTIAAPELTYLYTETSQLPGAGKGLKTAISIYSDEIIAIYRGQILTNAQAVSRAKANKDRYFISMPDGTVLDSMNSRCLAKFANDATAYRGSGFTNNSIISLDDEERVCLIATRIIRTGEEIFCSYGDKYWKKHRVKPGNN